MTRTTIDVALVRRLVAAQFPGWSDLPVEPVAEDGWDNRSFRLGDDLVVRLPSDAGYEPQVAKEHAWLPRLAPRLPLPVPAPVALGVPGEGYPYAWSVRRWLPGAPLAPGRAADLTAVAVALAEFLVALRTVDPIGGPPAGAHSAYRGAPVGTYDADVRQALAALGGEVDTAAAAAVWQRALAAPYDGPPVWFHGDVAGGNLLVDAAGWLAAVLDFGCCGVGDPACDTVAAWTIFAGPSRTAFVGGLDVDEAMWARGRGWALWKALVTLERDRDETKAADARRVLAEVLAEPSSVHR